MKEDDPGSKYFTDETTDRERAVFEAGITLGAIYHQFVGTPTRNEETLKKAIEESTLAHPFIVDAEVEVLNDEKSGDTPYEYPELGGKMLKVKLTSEYGDVQAVVGMKNVPELEYPLMHIIEIK